MTDLTPKLVMGHIVVMTPDGEEGIPYDDAVIHFEGDEDSEIEVHCPAALKLAPLIVKAVNNHDALVDALKEAVGVFESWHDDETEVELLPQLRSVLDAVENSLTGDQRS